MTTSPVYRLSAGKSRLASLRSREARDRVMLLLPFVVMILVTRLDFRLIGDEVFHKAVVDSFIRAWPFPNIGDYPATSTPLAYIVMSAVGRVVGGELWKMRLVAVAATYLAGNVFYDLARNHNLPYPILSALLFVFFPYIFFHGFTIYTDGLGLAFGLWALKLYLAAEATLRSRIAASVLAAVAVLTRQIYIVVPGGIVLYELWRVLRNGDFAAPKSRPLNWAILGIPFAVLLPIFWIWGGFTTPAHQGEKGGDFFLRLVPQHLSFFLAFIGFYFLPILGTRRFKATIRANKFVLLIPIILMPLYLLFPPIYSEERDLVGAATGILAHGMDLGGQMFGVEVMEVAKLALWVLGIVILAYGVLDSVAPTAMVKIVSILFSFLALMTFTPYVAERYYAMAIPWLIMILHRQFHNWKLLLIWLGLEAGLAVGFSYWQIALK